MKKMTMMRCLWVATVMLLLAACGKERFHIEGCISDAKDSILYLEHMSLDGPVKLDSVKLDADGSFAFAEEGVTAPEFYRLRIAGGIINVSIDSTETVRFKASYPTMSARYEVEGSENCKKIRELALLQQRLQAQVMAVGRDNSLGVAQTNDSIDLLIERYKGYVRENYIFKEPYKAYAYFALFQAIGNRLIFNPRESDIDIRTFAAVATSWDTFYPGEIRGENLHNIAVEGLKILRTNQSRRMGMIDPSIVSEESIIDIPLMDNNGRQRSLKELVGKVVILDFHVFASEGSMKRIMMLRDLYNKYHDRGLEIFQVALDPNEHFWKTQTAALPWICVRDPEALESHYLVKYNVQALPTFFIIDRSNALYKRDAQIKDLDQEITSLL